MFDELDNKNAVSGSGVRPSGPMPKKTEDIFSEVDKIVKPEVFKPRNNDSPPVSATVIPAETGWLKNKIMVFGLILGGLIIVVGGGYFGLKMMIEKSPPADTNTAVQEEEKNNQAETEMPNLIEQPSAEEVAMPLSQPIEPLEVTQPIDSDQDGLTDEEEISLGTNANNPDTDQDGLTDREEVKVYGTDPLYSDTDGDGYNDGEEVKNGFNPRGSGKLLDINNQIP